VQEKLIQELYEIENTYWWPVAKRKLLTDFARRYRLPAGPARAAEIGPGAGRTLIELKKIYETACGFELSPAAIGFCRERGLDCLVMADAEKGLPATDGSFDIAVCSDVLEHFEDDTAVMREIARVLAPGGVIVFSVPAYQFLFSYWDESHGHKRRYTKKEMAARLNEAGFDVLKLTYTNFFILPAAIAVRKLKGLMSRGEGTGGAGSDHFKVPPSVNRLLDAVYRAERVLIKHINLPFGLSVAGVARKK